MLKDIMEAIWETKAANKVKEKRGYEKSYRRWGNNTRHYIQK